MPEFIDDLGGLVEAALVLVGERDSREIRSSAC
jgi:hypothetical protein